MSPKNLVSRSIEVMIGTILGLTANQVYTAIKPKIETKVVEPIRELTESLDYLKKQEEMTEDSLPWLFDSSNCDTINQFNTKYRIGGIK